MSRLPTPGSNTLYVTGNIKTWTQTTLTPNPQASLKTRHANDNNIPGALVNTIS